MPELGPIHASPRRVDFPEGYHVHLRAALNRGAGTLLTLSEGGAYVATHLSLLPQAQLWLAIEIPELSRIVEVEAMVAWENRGDRRPSCAHPEGYGLKFTRIPDASAEAIFWLIRRDERRAGRDPGRTQALAPWEVQEAMRRAEARLVDD